MQPLVAPLLSTLVKCPNAASAQCASCVLGFEIFLERSQILNLVFEFDVDIPHALPLRAADVDPLGFPRRDQCLHLDERALLPWAQLAHDRMPRDLHRRTVSTLRGEVLLVNLEVSAGVAEIVSRGDLVDAITPLMDGDIARITENDLVVRRDLPIEADIAYGVHVLIELRLPRQFRLLQSLLHGPVLFQFFTVAFLLSSKAAGNKSRVLAVRLV
mmetsp:Transcript_14582/g.35131  ORF Transcript_14582/g.35131 Transcript_14582/m.35131 type:complete len:215 (+) Transcript_14582:2171-2815(+)